MWIKLSIPNDLQWYHITVHNMNQMYLPETDQVFGSYYLYLKIPKIKNGTCLIRDYKLTRTRWKTLDKARNRCDAGEAEAQTTQGCNSIDTENLRLGLRTRLRMRLGRHWIEKWLRLGLRLGLRLSKMSMGNELESF